MIRTKSVYEEPEPGDGYRLLVMRRWPRGISKDKVDAWEKELAPSTGLLAHWNKRQISFQEFKGRYMEEIKDKKELLGRLVEKAEKDTVTLLCWEAEEKQCHRGILREYLEKWK